MNGVLLVDSVDPDGMRGFAWYCRDCGDCGRVVCSINVAYRAGEYHHFEECPYRSSLVKPSDSYFG